MNKLKECKLLITKESKTEIITQMTFWFICNYDDDDDDDNNEYGLW